MWQILGNKVFLAVVGAFCAALISVLLYAINLRGQIADLHEENADLRENLTLAISQSEISKANLDACVAKIELVNEKTQSLRAKSEEAEQKAKRAGERLARVQAPQKDAGCERELKFYKELMNASY